jgi:UDP-GlcNAc:undecaprenyl-phosphate GlcNAc-1-phosphate transferase
MYIGTQREWPGDYLIGIAYGLVGAAACLVVTLMPSRRVARGPVPETVP